MRETPVPAETPLIDPALLALLEQKLGHRIPERRFRQVGDTVLSLATESGYTSISEYLALARSLPMDSPLVQSLVHAITNKESYFFRDAATVSSLREHVLPEVISRCSPRKTLSVWSAGCSTGEEIYTLAILLRELIHDYDDWKICLLGTDIDEVAVRRARKGRYKRWSLRTATDAEKVRYFHSIPESSEFSLRELYRKNVAFGLHNLADGTQDAPSPGMFDLIFCRNVLIYFGEQAQNVVHRKFRNALGSGGLWIGGSSDPSPGADWTTRVLPGVLAHSPEAKKPQVVKAPVERCAPKPARSASPGAGRIANAPPPLQPRSSSPLPPPLPLVPPLAARTSRSALHEEAMVPSGTLSTIEARLEEASRLADRGALIDAVKVLGKVIEEAPLTAEAYLLLAQVQQSLGHPEAAIHELKRAVYLDPSNAAAQLRLGFLLAEQGGTAAAIRAFRAATALISGLESPEPEEVEIRRIAAAELVRLMREEK